MRMRYIVPVVLVLCMAAVMLLWRSKPGQQPHPIIGKPVKRTIRYFALGDSYTYGEGVANHQRWPDQLAVKLRGRDIPIEVVGNPSLTGYTTQDVVRAELPEMHRAQPDFVTLLIGVNDYVQGVPPDVFQQRLSAILDEVQASLTDRYAVVLVTIPDFGKTPVGASFGEEDALEQGIKTFNDVIRREAASRGIGLADIFPVSQRVTSDPSLLAADKLHPSGKQYALWADIVIDEITRTGILNEMD